MKKYISCSLIYAIAAMAGGVFYREFTKFKGFTGETALSRVHTHLFMLGMFMFLIVALFERNSDLSVRKSFRVFMYLYNIGLPLMVVMMIVRGVFQVLGTELSPAADASISGVAGIAHILVSVGIVFLLTGLRRQFSKR
ncbi:MAG TPA: DUF2871 domain-containing protein [Clostridiales bacterium]|jgi:nitric oxide reductase large subunit|nr:DUF2871 domain-containing protein [Clostridiales bacterium]